MTTIRDLTIRGMSGVAAIENDIAAGRLSLYGSGCGARLAKFIKKRETRRHMNVKEFK